MLQTIFRDKNGYRLENEVLNVDLSGGTLLVRRMNQNEHLDSTQMLNLCTVVSRSEGKLQAVKIEGITQASPEYLAFLIATCSKAYEVNLKSCCFSDSVCTIFMSSMMNPDGIRELSISSRSRIASVHQARLLFQGVALSVSLQKLEMLFDFEDMEDSGIALGQAFQKNQSLKSFSLYSRSLHSDVILEHVARAAASSSSLETWTINAPHSIRHGVRRLSLSTLQECLCREDCSLQQLILESIVLDCDLREDLEQRNSSLTTMKLRGRESLSCSQAVRFAKSFKSLKHLDIDFEPQSELSSLEELLIGDESTLQSLKLYVEPRPEMDEEWTRLIEKLPRMKSLRSLDLPREVFRSDSCRNALLTALQLNTCIERINLLNLGRTNLWGNDEDEAFADLYCNISHLLSINRGGRQYLQNAPMEQPLARNLWPYVLERALGIDYVSDYDKSKYPKLESLDCDVVYWLLREKFFT